MAKRGDPSVLRYVVNFLRFHAGLLGGLVSSLASLWRFGGPSLRASHKLALVSGQHLVELF
jgi:hypothetical protein